MPLQTEVSLFHDGNKEYASLIQSNFYSVDFGLGVEELRTILKVKFSISVLYINYHLRYLNCFLK